jgi:hypothetical protein
MAEVREHIQTLFSRDRTVAFTYRIPRGEGGWTNSHHYRCRAALRFNGVKWVPMEACNKQVPVVERGSKGSIAGYESYRRHLRDVHLCIPRDPKKRALSPGSSKGIEKESKSSLGKRKREE